MKAKYLNIAATAAMALALTACSDDDLSSTSIFSSASTEVNGAFEQWLEKNFVEPYNVRLTYRYVDSQTSQSHNLVPADSAKSVVIAKLLKHLWLDAYSEAVSQTFIKSYSPRIYQLLGSLQYNTSGSVTMGVAEGGIMVTLTGVNEIDPENLYCETTSIHPDYNTSTTFDMNKWFFHTMHHEFCHILTQTKNYDTSFADITHDSYNPNGWINTDFDDVITESYVTPYASQEYNEDFAEIYSTYVTHTPEAWDNIMNATLAVQYDANGNVVYEQKSDGSYVYLTDADGNKIEETQEFSYTSNSKNYTYNYLVPQTDADGNIIYEQNADGSPVYYTYNGSPVTMTANTNTTLMWRYFNGQLRCYFLYNGIPYAADANQNWGDPLYQTDAKGDTVYDANGQAVRRYFRLPKFEYAKQPAYDYTGYNNLTSKLAIIKDYMLTSWGIDMDKLRDVVIRRTGDINTLDYKSLND